MNVKFVITGIVLIIIGIVLGAFGAHGLKAQLVNFPEKLESFETGVKYQMYSGFSFLIIGLNASKFTFSIKNIFVSNNINQGRITITKKTVGSLDKNIIKLVKDIKVVLYKVK